MAGAVLLDQLTHRYGAREALRGVSLTVERGEICGLLGPNGGGKTTTFRILSTALIPSGGSAAVFDHDVVTDAAAVRRQIGVVFQSPSLDLQLTVDENLRHQGHLYGLSGSTLAARMQDVLARLGLTDRARDLAKTLSGGLRRRVEVAKSLLHRPSLLLLDEPATGLDPGARRDLWSALKELQARDGVTALVTTHLMEEAARCDRVAILHQGRLVALGTPAALTAAIGGDVLTIATPSPEALCAQMRRRFGGEPAVVDGTVRLERAAGHTFLPQLVEAFPGQITAVTVGKPTLEDVFVHHTGHRFAEDQERTRQPTVLILDFGFWILDYGSTNRT